MPSYQPERFPVIQILELPFVLSDRRAASNAAWRFAVTHARSEFADVHLLSVHTIGANQFHLRERAVRSMADLVGKRIRAPTPLAGRMVSALGAVPVLMPGPRVYAALADKQVDGALMTWDFLGSSKTFEVTRFHTETDEGLPMIGTSVIVFAMNRARYAGLAPELRRVLDDNSGAPLADWIAGVLGATEGPWRAMVERRGNRVTHVDNAEVMRWRAATRPVVDAWASEMQARGFDARAMLRDLESGGRP